MAGSGGAPLLKVVSACKEFSGVRVLNNVSFALSAGEILGIIGENGAGKSTLLKIISGIYTPTSGEFFFDGEPMRTGSAAEAKRLGITLIPQEFNLVKDLNVFENIFLGAELRSGPLLDKKAMAAEAKRLLDRLGVVIDPREKMENLSVAQKQMVEFAKALSRKSRVLIMDEPTTVLTPPDVRMLFSIIGNLRNEGVAIIYISHKLREVKEICDRVMVLRDGEFVSLDRTEEVGVHEMATRMVGRELSQLFPPKNAPSEEAVLSVEDLSVEGLLSGVSFSLRRGEILGFSGLMGAGRTEVAETLLGLRRKTSGRVSVKGREADIRTPSDAVKLGISYLSEDRQGKGILVKFGISSNISLVSLARYCGAWGLINKKKEREQASEYVREFSIKAASLSTNLEFFSGGNQQKVSLAKCMDTDPEILIIDEPTRGIDVNAKREIYHFIHTLVEKGLSCILISSELEEILGLCHRTVVMHEGRVSGILEGEHLNEEEIMFHATGLKESVLRSVGQRTDI